MLDSPHSDISRRIVSILMQVRMVPVRRNDSFWIACGVGCIMQHVIVISLFAEKWFRDGFEWTFSQHMFEILTSTNIMSSQATSTIEREGTFISFT